MSNEATFFELFMAGKALPDEIHDYIDRWRAIYSKVQTEKVVPLYRYLGLTEAEYDVWIHDDNSLKLFVIARESNRRLKDVMSERWGQMSVAARAEDKTKLAALHNWLQVQQRCE